MSRVLFILILTSTTFAAPENDPQYCAYWIKHFEMIAACEINRIEITPQIYQNEGKWSAVDFDIDMREAIRDIIKKLARD